MNIYSYEFIEFIYNEFYILYKVLLFYMFQTI